MISPTLLILAAILLGAGFWIILRGRVLLAFLERRGALSSNRRASLSAITILAIGIGLAGLGCSILTRGLATP
ncbi:MAG TPA: hypothetical protein VER55_03490 [Ardenticatenaceae bacterium]|nr:hypothetical protein [Ardenticatenaceae bacterium]